MYFGDAEVSIAITGHPFKIARKPRKTATHNCFWLRNGVRIPSAQRFLAAATGGRFLT